MIAFLLGLLALVAPAQDERWYLTDEEVELVDLLNTCSKGMGLALDYDRALVQGRVTIRSEGGYTSEGLWALANRLLAAKKLAVVQASGEEALGIVPLGEAVKVARVEQDPRVARAGYVKTVKNLHYAEGEKIAESLRTVLGGEGSLVQPIKDARAVLLAGPKAQVVEALELVRHLDSPTPPMVPLLDPALAQRGHRLSSAHGGALASRPPAGAQHATRRPAGPTRDPRQRPTRG